MNTSMTKEAAALSCALSPELGQSSKLWSLMHKEQEPVGRGWGLQAMLKVPLFVKLAPFSSDVFPFKLVTQSCLCDPLDCSPPGSTVHGILQATILEWVAIPFSRGSSQPRYQTFVPYIGRQILYR